MSSVSPTGNVITTRFANVAGDTGDGVTGPAGIAAIHPSVSRAAAIATTTRGRRGSLMNVKTCRVVRPARTESDRTLKPQNRAGTRNSLIPGSCISNAYGPGTSVERLMTVSVGPSASVHIASDAAT